MSRLDPELVRLRVRRDPVCEHRDADGYCTRLSSSAIVVPEGDTARVADYRARCSDHAGDGPKVCIGCGRINTGRDPIHCVTCANRWQDGAADDRGAWR